MQFQRNIQRKTQKNSVLTEILYKNQREVAVFNTVSSLALCRDEATRTPDPYVPNVVRYQLRYIPIF